MQISLNGHIEVIEGGMTLSDLLRLKNIDPATVVIEQNRDIIDKDKYGTVGINENDTIEILKFVGGG